MGNSSFGAGRKSGIGDGFRAGRIKTTKKILKIVIPIIIILIIIIVFLAIK